MSEGKRTGAEASKDQPCPICGQRSWCLLFGDGGVNCYRADGPGSIERQDRQGQVYWVHPPAEERPKPTFQATEAVIAVRADADRLDRLYRELQCQLSLSAEHEAALVARGLSIAAIRAYGFRTMHAAASVRSTIAQHIAGLFNFWQAVPGFYAHENGTARLAASSGLMVFGSNLQGQVISVQLRLDEVKAGDSRYRWFSSAKHGGPGPGAPATYWRPATTKILPGVVRICEGAFKALGSAERTGIPAIAAGAGVGSMASNQVEEMLREIQPATVLFTPDQDFFKPEVAQRIRSVLGRLQYLQQQLGFELLVEVWGAELPEDARPKGIDDAMLAGLAITTMKPEDYRRILPFSEDGPESGHPPGDLLDTPEPQLNWEKPVPLDAPVIKPKFPIDALPPLARRFALAVAEAFQVPASYAASLVLGTASIASLKRQVVDCGRGPVTALNEWFNTVLESGSGKSGCMHVVLSPVYAFERKLVARAETPEGQTNEVGLVSSDPTPESLEKRLHANDGRYACCNSEAGDLLSIAAGRYSATSKSGANLGIYLKGFSGETHRPDRVLRGATFIEEPRLTMVLALQPSVFERFCTSVEMRERGFWARFLLDNPDSLLGYRKSDPKPVPADLREAWHNLITYLLGIDPTRDEEGRLRPYCIPVNSKASAVLGRFQEWSERGLRADQYWESCREFGARAKEHVIKLAGLLHILGNFESGAPWEYAISEETVEAAIRVFSYYAEHIRIVSGSASERRRDVRLEYVLTKIQSKAEWKQTFKARALWQLVKGRGGVQSMDDLKHDLARLEEHGFVRLLEGKGRSLSYAVSPHLTSSEPPPRPQSAAEPFAIGPKSGGTAAPSPSPIPESGGSGAEDDFPIEGDWGQLGIESPPEFSHTPKASYEGGGNGGAFPVMSNSPEFVDVEDMF
ncbi:MAG: DUF3987 domain-containing protein [Candidatus Eremiobacteraeota bacterium]|nr:DUF3987 domain-containing protein [Candidatus Eremiobacteraeota bacterium]MCW5869258.1 DUF3987 domain-containing protein [Candidatus Eremiobacteraeota bacterium]